MRQFQISAFPGFRLPGAASTIVVALGLAACLNDIPPELKSMVDSRLPLVISLAKTAAPRCAAHKATDDPASLVSPAANTALATDLNVVEIIVRCNWEVSHNAAGGGDRSFAFPSLRQAARHSHSPLPKLVYDTFVKVGDHDFERVIVPSQFSAVAGSADIVATQPIPGGGTVEITVAMVSW